MISSMTGFARKEILMPEFSLKMELKSLNHRFLEINTFFNKELSFLEPEARKYLSNYFNRGKIDAYASCKFNNASFLIPKLNYELLKQIIESLANIDIPINKNISIDIAQLLTLPNVFSLIIDEDLMKEKIEPVFIENWKELVRELKDYRESEGKILYDSIMTILAKFDEKIMIVKNYLSENKNLIEQSIREKIKEFKLDNQIDTQRFNEEILYYIIKMDLSEEVTRLEAHLKRFQNLITTKDQVGKELDFILQEMNREVHTMLAKAALQEISDTMIELKCDIEKIRQQVQNIE
jgi:uncharacterized protein (TIGR00255 family)